MSPLSLSYWFNSRPEPFTALGQSILIIAIALFSVLAIIAWVYYKKKLPIYHKLWSSLLTFGLTNAIIGLAWTFFNYQMIPILMSKIWYLLWFIGVIIWIIFLALKIKRIPTRKQELAKEKEFKKYLPK